GVEAEELVLALQGVQQRGHGRLGLGAQLRQGGCGRLAEVVVVGLEVLDQGLDGLGVGSPRGGGGRQAEQAQRDQTERLPGTYLVRGRGGRTRCPAVRGNAGRGGVNTDGRPAFPSAGRRWSVVDPRRSRGGGGEDLLVLGVVLGVLELG